ELLESRFAAIQDPVAPPPPPPIGARRDDWYMEFEETHRGSAEDIRQRQRRYLPFVREAIPEPSAGRVLDLGCGRGDWLALLGEEGFEALGVDNNAALVDAARRAGLHVHKADLFDYLKSLTPHSLAAITAFQLVEHLPLDNLLALFAEVRRVLRPGGLLILETPNPENLQVGAYSFWMDPTHVRPLPPPLLHQLARHFGFIDVRIERLNPWPQYREDAESVDPLNRLLYCGQDYALIARAPLGPEPA
ncbi:MAG: class I SAM-dependent methyltransferase, partial [Thermochromatium sp.]